MPQVELPFGERAHKEDNHGGGREVEGMGGGGLVGVLIVQS